MQEVFNYLEEMKSRGDEKAKELLLAYAFYEQLRSESDDDEDIQDKTFIVVASFVKNKNKPPTVHHGYCRKIKDTWTSHEEIETARVQYNDYLKRDDLYSASICKVIVSTDYF